MGRPVHNNSHREFAGEMQQGKEFVDLLGERRKDCDAMWVSRPLNQLVPYKLPVGSKYSRNQAIEAALANPRVSLVIESLAAARHVDVNVVRREALEMLEEMANKEHLPTVRWIGLLVTKALKRILVSVRINQTFLLELRGRMGNGQVQYVYAPSHRSYLDFILLSYILFSYDMALPNIASGMDFYRMRFVGELLRYGGAFYMRRTFATDNLYKEVFRAYVASLVAHSERAIEFFIEGTRSRSQKSLAPKYGLLAMIIEGLLKGDVPDIQFIPMSISYDRPLEELLFAYELLGVPKPPESTTGLFKSLSILREPFAYGHVYLRMAEPISARQFLDSATRRASALSPHSKPPPEAVKALAYAIVDSQKKYTALTSFNLIALLFNERVQTHPNEPYTLETLLIDYSWLKRLLSRTVGAVIHPGEKPPGEEVLDEDERNYVLESLTTHRELLAFNSIGQLQLMERHRETRPNNPQNVKGHPLSGSTMRLAVPAINLTIYTNPCLAFVIKPALVTISIVESRVSKERSFELYLLLRGLLDTEFALAPGLTKLDYKKEWEEGLSLLLSEGCIRLHEDCLVPGSNTKMLSLIRNLLLPFMAAARVTCSILQQWDDQKMGNPEERRILKESQKQAELLLIEDRGIVRHPYALSLDLYSSTLVSLVSSGMVIASGKPRLYRPDKIQLATLIAELDKLLVHRPPGSYLDVILSLVPQTTIAHVAKL